jgi:hypothetical protein
VHTNANVILSLLCILLPVRAVDFGEGPGYLIPEHELAIVELSEYSKAFRNPFKGFRGEFNDAQIGKYGTLTRTYIRWNDVENNEHDGIDKIIAYCNTYWSGVEHTNTKVIPRVYLHWPNRGTYWPDDMITGDYDSDKFRDRVVSLIKKLGEVWDDDPRVAFIEMGIWGLWGEHHHEAFGGFGQLPRMPPDMQKLLGDAFRSAFRNKLVMVRYPDDFRDYRFGFHWDSFAHPEQENHVVEFLSPRLKDRWKSAVMGGEMAFDWGTGLGTGPTDAVVNHHEAIVNAVRLLHWNHLGWVSDYDQDNPVARENAEIIQKALGYRFVIDTVRYTKRIEADGELYFSFDVRNTGSSPVYYNLPVEVTLLEEKNRTPVWKGIIPNIDIRSWLPGDDWNTAERKYEIAPEKYTIEYMFTLPAGIPSGEYIVALAVLDPAGNVPALRFANTNYFTGGLHPIGRIGIMTEIRTFMLDPLQFDDLSEDRSLYYIR